MRATTIIIVIIVIMTIDKNKNNDGFVLHVIDNSSNNINRIII